VVHVAAKLFSGELPVAGDNPLLNAAHHGGARLGAVEHGVHIGRGVAQIGLEVGGLGIPICEDQALVGFHARLQRTPVGFVEAAIAFFLVTKGAFFERHVDQVAGDVIGPAVVGAGEGLGVARIGAANAHATVAALVEEDFDAAVFLAHHDHRVFTHVGGHVVPGLGDVGIVPKQQPGATEDALELELVQFLVGVNARVDQALVLIDQCADGLVRPATLERHRHGLHFAFRMYSHDAGLLVPKLPTQKSSAHARTHRAAFTTARLAYSAQTIHTGWITKVVNPNAMAHGSR